MQVSVMSECRVVSNIMTLYLWVTREGSTKRLKLDVIKKSLFPSTQQNLSENLIDPTVTLEM